MRKFSPQALSFATILGMTLSLAGCGNEEPDRQSSTPAPDTTRATGTVESEAGKAQVSTSGLDLPDGWPEDVPIPEDGKIQVATELPGVGHKLTFGTDKSIDEMVAYFQAEMPKHRWQGSEVVAAGNSSMLTYRQDGRMVMMNLSNSSGAATAVTITSRKTK